MSEMVASYCVHQPPAALQRMALELAFEALPISQRADAVNEVLEAAARGERLLAGLFAAWRNNDVAAALWAEIHPGASASVWPPQLMDGVAPQLADMLIEHSLAWLKANDVDLVQSLLATDTGDDAARLLHAGFEHSCDLLYLVSQAEQFPTGGTWGGLAFNPVMPDDFDCLADLVEQTYEQTLDCPALDAKRDCREVLKGYRATCRGDLSHWFTVRYGKSAIGCLLLGHEASGQTWELVYMGLVRAARGRGWGLEIVRFAQWLVTRENGARLVLAVDAANEPAIRIYAAAGFSAWDRRSVYLKWLSPIVG